MRAALADLSMPAERPPYYGDGPPPSGSPRPSPRRGLTARVGPVGRAGDSGPSASAVVSPVPPLGSGASASAHRWSRIDEPLPAIQPVASPCGPRHRRSAGLALREQRHGGRAAHRRRRRPPASPTNAASVTVSFDAVLRRRGRRSSYTALPERDPRPARCPRAAARSPPDAGNYNLQVRAVQRGPRRPSPTPSRSWSTAPTPSDRRSRSSGASANGWFRTLQIAADVQRRHGPRRRLSVADPVERPPRRVRPRATVTMSVTDAARQPGHRAVAGLQVRQRRSRPGRASIGPATVVGAAADVQLVPSTDADSGVNEYRVQWQPDEDFDPDGWQTLATVPVEAGRRLHGAARRPGAAPRFPRTCPLVWRVVAVDNAGNARASNPSARRAS